MSLRFPKVSVLRDPAGLRARLAELGCGLPCDEELLPPSQSPLGQPLALRHATGGTHEFMKQNGIESECLRWPLEQDGPNTLDYIRGRKLDLVVNIPKNFQEDELTNDYMIRRAAVDYAIPLITNLQLALRLAEALARKSADQIEIKSWQSYKE